MFVFHHILLLSLCLPTILSLRFVEKRAYHAAKVLSTRDVIGVASLYNETYLKEVLNHILVPRIVGTEGHEKVKQFIISEMNNLGMIVEQHTFHDVAPRFGTLQFSNLIGRWNQNATRYLTLACHYDSKYLPPKFDGATDSAVPCAMMLEIVHALKPFQTRFSNSDLSLKLIFFDGEEAFVEWSETDSLYGSRRLASKWQRTPFPPGANETNVLDSIDILVLLDLLGAKNAKLYSFFRETQRWHSLLTSIERKLKAMGAIPASQPLHFLEKSTYSSVQDDHLPFLNRDVPILHLIPIPFPREWHTAGDDYSILDFPTIATLTKVLQVFVLSYLDGNVPIAYYGQP